VVLRSQATFKLAWGLAAWTFAVVGVGTQNAPDSPARPSKPAGGPVASDVRQGEAAKASANGRINANANVDARGRANDASGQSGTQARQRMQKLAQQYAGDDPAQNTSRDPSSTGNTRAGTTRNGSTSSDQARQRSNSSSQSDSNHRGPDEPLGPDGEQPATRNPLDDRYPQRTKSLGGKPNAAQTQPSSVLGNAGSGNWFLQTLAALGLVIGLVLFGRWAWMKLSGQVSATGNGPRAVEVLSRTAVAPKNHVLLLRVGQRVLVVGDSAQGLRTLTEVNDPDEVADLLTSVTAQKENSATSSFQQMLGQVSGNFDEQALAADHGRDNSEHHFDRSRAAVSSLVSRVRSMANRGVS